MALVFGLLTFSLAIGLGFKRVGLGTYLAIYFVTIAASVAFMLLYFRLFIGG